MFTHNSTPREWYFQQQYRQQRKEERWFGKHVFISQKPCNRATVQPCNACHTAFAPRAARASLLRVLVLSGTNRTFSTQRLTLFSLWDGSM